MKSVLLSCLICISLMNFSAFAQDEEEDARSLPLSLGGGLRIQNNLPILLAELHVSQLSIGTEAGINTSRLSVDDVKIKVSSSFNSMYAKFYLPMGELPISLYGGGGVMLISTEAELDVGDTEIFNEINSSALIVFGGIETRIGLMAFFADFRIQPVGEVSFRVDGTDIEVPLGLSTLSADFGVRFDYHFSLM